MSAAMMQTMLLGDSGREVHSENGYLLCIRDDPAEYREQRAFIFTIEMIIHAVPT